jgi:hypothetical protein
MAANQDISISWNAEELVSELNNLNRAFTSNEYGGLLMLMQTAATKMETWAKQNAPWTDRTGQARQRLTGQAYWKNKNIVVAAIAHQVDYGIWLELAHQRRYAILERALEEHRGEIEEAVKTLLKRYANT